jgi:hypothetical protein
MRLFSGKSLEEVREIAFEIGMLGQHGLDINDPRETHVLRALPGRTFSALELLCIMYAGFKQIEPGMAIGVDPLARSGGLGMVEGRREFPKIDGREQTRECPDSAEGRQWPPGARATGRAMCMDAEAAWQKARERKTEALGAVATEMQILYTS